MKSPVIIPQLGSMRGNWCFGDMLFFVDDLDFHAEGSAESKYEGSGNVEKAGVRDTEDGPRPDTRVSQLVGDTPDQEECQSGLMELGDSDRASWDDRENREVATRNTEGSKPIAGAP